MKKRKDKASQFNFMERYREAKKTDKGRGEIDKDKKEKILKILFLTL